MNYKKLEFKYIDEVRSDATVYEHIKTGARVLTLKNKDRNKAFGIGFRTPPEKGDGVAHIVEHCVLSGSRKYRTKEPFVDLIKSSLQTFLNAMTYPDKTIYPVSSRNKKDFYNLMDVYLDAVFHPRMYENEMIFRQEGWHYEIFDKDEPIKINGVVYNEMKGNYSVAENVVSDALTFNLHKDSSYGVDSGGDPLLIPTLSYEEFLNFHKKFYHPSNSYIYLYGDLDMEEALDFIDKNYLSDFEKKEIDSSIILNEDFNEPKYLEITYPAAEEDLGDSKDYIAIGWCVGRSDNSIEEILRNLTLELLIGADSAILKQEILKEKLAEDVSAMGSSSLPLDMSMILKNADSKNLKRIEKLIEEVLTDIVKNGIDRDLLEATLNKFELSIRQGGGTQKAIIYFARAMETWLYDASPLDGLMLEKSLRTVKEKLKDGYLEKFIEEKILKNPYKIVVVASPEVGKSEREFAIVKGELEEYKASLTEEELEDLIAKSKALVEFQTGESTKEEKATIPKLEISDIDPEIERHPYEVLNINDVEIIKTKEDCHGLIYLTLSFDSSCISEEELENFAYVCELIGDVSTKNYSYIDLDNEINKNAILNIYPSHDYIFKSSDDFYRRLNISITTTAEKLERILEITDEIRKNSRFDEKDRIRELFLLEKSSFESLLLHQGHTFVSSIVASKFNALSDYAQKVSGTKLYFKIKDLLNDYEARFKDLDQELKKILEKLFVRENLIVSIGADEETIDDATEKVKGFVEDLPSKKINIYPYNFKEDLKSTGYYISSNVNYVSKGYSYKKLGYEFKGDMVVLSNILNTEFLHYQIRAKGGAYGAGVTFSRSGNLVTYSYRDPNLKKTLEVYDEMYRFIENLEIEKDELDSYIIGAMNSFDPLLTPAVSVSLNLSRHLSGLKHEDVENFKREALNTDLESLKSYSRILKEAMSKNLVCALGSKQAILENSEEFDEIISIK